MKKLLIIIMCSMLIAGCSSTDNKTAESHSKPVQQEIVKKDQPEQEKSVNKKDETKTENKNKTETVKKEEKKDNQKKTTSKKTTTTVKKKTSTKKKTENKDKTSTKKKTNTTKKKNSITLIPNDDDFICTECGKHFTSYAKLDKHLNKTNHGGYGYSLRSDEEWPDDWVGLE